MRFVDLVGKSARPPPQSMLGVQTMVHFVKIFDRTNQSLKAIGNFRDENSEYLRSMGFSENSIQQRVVANLMFPIFHTVLPALPGPCFLDPQKS